MMARTTTSKVVALNERTNGAEEAISFCNPYSIEVKIKGAADILFHRWNCEAVAEKGAAAKNSKAKKTDNIESYVYRNDKNELCLPGTYLRGAIINAARYRQDPRSPRKSAMDLFKAGIVSTTTLASFGVEDWEYLDSQHAIVQRQGITRARPALLAGWELTFELLCLLPEYIDANLLREVIESAGRLVGLADYRPTYGRFGIVGYRIL